MSQHVAQECNEQFALVQYDQAIAKSVLKIQEEETHKNNNVFICFGPYRNDLHCMPRIYIIKSSEASEVLCSADVLASGWENGFLS